VASPRHQQRARSGDKNLAGVDLSDADLTGLDLSDANLTGANLNGAILVNTDLCGASLEGADLTLAELENAVQASAAELRIALRDSRALCVDGRWCGVDAQLELDVMEIALAQCVKHEWPLSAVPVAECVAGCLEQATQGAPEVDYVAPDGTDGIDLMQNGRFARNIVERAERLRDSRVAAQHRAWADVIEDAGGWGEDHACGMKAVHPGPSGCGGQSGRSTKGTIFARSNGGSKATS
jgi:hypothetical protein